jgi:hypothetical protein
MDHKRRERPSRWDLYTEMMRMTRRPGPIGVNPFAR